MQELKIEENEHDQRLDRFISKYLDKAPRGFIYRMIRRKNIEVNTKRAQPETMLKKGDTVQLWLADDTIEKFRSDFIAPVSDMKLDIVYEDENIILINKERGILSHSSGDQNEDNIVDSMINYLIDKGDYNPEEESTFIPSICNRLDRNTSGIIIGGKNYQAVKDINEAIKNRTIRRLYKTIVLGRFEGDLKAEDYIIKDDEKNQMSIASKDLDDAKDIETHFRVLDIKEGYSILEVELITGRTHQIRIHLSSLGFPIIGDRKYGKSDVNDYFKSEYGLNNQCLHGYKVEFNGLEELSYLNGKSFVSQPEDSFKQIERQLF